MDTLHEDQDVIAVNKPAGIAVIPGRDEKPDQALRGQLESLRGERLWVVHRLDRDTSGVVLFARNEQAHRRLSMAFEGREVSKTYLAWTRGVPQPAEGVITVPLHPARKGKMRPAHEGEAGGLASETAYRVLASREAIAEVEVSPRTGRQHQIRVHMRAIGAPLLVDPFYGKCESIESGVLGAGSPALPRLTLHAWKLAYGELRVIAPLPGDLAALQAWLRDINKASA